jgi:hypothetical protein
MRRAMFPVGSVPGSTDRVCGPGSRTGTSSGAASNEHRRRVSPRVRTRATPRPPLRRGPARRRRPPAPPRDDAGRAGRSSKRARAADRLGPGCPILGTIIELIDECAQAAGRNRREGVSPHGAASDPLLGTGTSCGRNPKVGAQPHQAWPLFAVRFPSRHDADRWACNTKCVTRRFPRQTGARQKPTSCRPFA